MNVMWFGRPQRRPQRRPAGEVQAVLLGEWHPGWKHRYPPQKRYHLILSGRFHWEQCVLSNTNLYSSSGFLQPSAQLPRLPVILPAILRQWGCLEAVTVLCSRRSLPCTKTIMEKKKKELKLLMPKRKLTWSLVSISDTLSAFVVPCRCVWKLKKTLKRFSYHGCAICIETIKTCMRALVAVVLDAHFAHARFYSWVPILLSFTHTHVVTIRVTILTFHIPDNGFT